MNDKRRHSDRTRGLKNSADDNVIYANFGARKRVDKPVDHEAERIKLVRSRPLQGSAGLELRRMVQENADDGRYQRGIDYARSGHVVDI